MGARFARLFGCVLASVLVAACSAQTGEGGLLAALRSSDEPATKSAQKSVVATPELLVSVDMAGGAIVIKGPEGFCIDKATLKKGLAGFALLAGCASMTGGKAGNYIDPAILTVTVGGPGSGAKPPTLQNLIEAFPGTPPMRTAASDNLQIVQVKGGHPALKPGADAHWRGVMALNGRMIGLAAYGPKGSQVAGARGGAVISALAGEIRKASPERKGLFRSSEKSAEKQPEDTKTRRGLLRRLFN